MRKSLLVSAAVAALGVATVSEGAVIATTINRGTPASASVTATGYTGYVLHLSSTSGKITAVDFSAQGRGIFGPMVQRWIDPDDGGVYTGKTTLAVNQNVTAANNNLDSHFLPPLNDIANVLVGTALNEDNNTTSPNPPFPANTTGVGFGKGTFLTGAYGIAGPAQSTELDIAYIVLQNGVTGTFNVSVAVSDGAPITVQGTIPVPEPVGMSLAGLGALGLMARRRRA
jgi:hypothetical protein